jgi:molybdopterin/thiamine biosynthesis adenylyltransferase
LDIKSSEKERYARQMIISGWGEEGQARLKNATVFIAGAGGLGSPVAVYLAAAGIGTLRICDNGEPELSNLNRQILHSEADIGINKALSAKDSIKNINPNVLVEPLTDMIKEDTVKSVVGDADIIVDCLDNFETRHVLNEFAVKNSLPFIHAGIHGLSGQVTFIHSPETPCLRCVFPGVVPKQIFPVAGVTPGIIGTIEAAEALKWLVGIGENLKNKLLIWDGDIMDFQKVEIKKDPDCPVCGK